MDGVPLDELYLEWLYDQVADPGYWGIFKILFSKEFTWQVANDDNRILDGKELRRRFLREKNIAGADKNWIELGCSVLELMVGLSERLAFIADGQPRYWFWVLMANLGLDTCDDGYELLELEIDEILDRVIYRTYDPDGCGGFFPLQNPSCDQTKVELWHQLSEYVIEIEQ